MNKFVTVPLSLSISLTATYVRTARLISVWGNDFPVARLGQGAFRTALEAVYKVCTLDSTHLQRVTDGIELPATTFGKPELMTYEYANALLQDLIRDTSKDASSRVAPENVWMIGDNPFSDIHGTCWTFSHARRQ
ncbi:hypothetical protein ACI68E_000397 [Malassezia pachydermatis]